MAKGIAGFGGFSPHPVELEPFLHEAIRYRDQELLEQAKWCLLGIIADLYRFRQESESEFKDWAPDDARFIAKELINEVLVYADTPPGLEEIDHFLADRCNAWLENFWKARRRKPFPRRPPGD